MANFWAQEAIFGHSWHAPQFDALLYAYVHSWFKIPKSCKPVLLEYQRLKVLPYAYGLPIYDQQHITHLETKEIYFRQAKPSIDSIAPKIPAKNLPGHVLSASILAFYTRWHALCCSATCRTTRQTAENGTRWSHEVRMFVCLEIPLDDGMTSQAPIGFVGLHHCFTSFWKQTNVKVWWDLGPLF